MFLIYVYLPDPIKITLKIIWNILGGGGGHQNVAFLLILIALMPVMSRKHSNHSKHVFNQRVLLLFRG